MAMGFLELRREVVRRGESEQQIPLHFTPKQQAIFWRRRVAGKRLPIEIRISHISRETSEMWGTRVSVGWENIEHQVHSILNLPKSNSG
jgi:hypothetical protein